MAIPPEVTDAINGALSDTNDFMSAFTAGYLEAFVQKKLDDLMNDAASTALPGAPELSIDAFIGGGGEDDSGDGDADAEAEATDEKDGGDEKESAPFVAGVSLVGFRLLDGPDKAKHRYYDAIAFTVTPGNSVVRRITRTHRVLLRDHPQLLASNNAPDGLEFPKKKWGKKRDSYYKTRFANMQEFYDAVSSSPASLEDEFLTQFDLRADDAREERLEIFKAALDAVCEEKGIDIEACLDRAEEIGIDSEEPELLKLVAVDAIGGPAGETIRDGINENMPGFVPQKVKNKVINKSETQLSSGIATAIETQWTAMGPIFEQLAKTIQEVLDTAGEPIGAVMNAAATPLGNVIKEKFGDGEAPEPSIGRDIVLDRYPWVTELMNGLEAGKAAAALTTFEKKVKTFSNKADYAGYLVYDFGPDWVRELNVPYLEDVADPHELLVNSLLEAWIVLSAGGVKALKPIFEFKDAAADNFDAGAFQAGLRDAVRKGGQALAKDYFDLPKTLRRSVRRLGNKSTSIVLKLAQKTVEAMVNALGEFAVNWNPQNAAELTPTFVDSMQNAMLKFGNLTASRFLTTILCATQLSLVNLAMAELGDAIAEVSETLDSLVSTLPDPIGEYVKAGDICTQVLEKLVFKAAFFAISQVARPSHDQFYNVGAVRRTILHVEPASEPAPSENDAAQAAAEDAGNNTSDEEGDDEDDGEEAAPAQE